MKRLILLLTIVLFSVVVKAQTKSKPELVADETTLQVNKSSIKLVTCNEEIMQAFLKQYSSNFDKYTVEFKHHIKFGNYKQYTINFKLDQEPELREFLTSYK